MQSVEERWKRERRRIGAGEDERRGGLMFFNAIDERREGRHIIVAIRDETCHCETTRLSSFASYLREIPLRLLR